MNELTKSKLKTVVTTVVGGYGIAQAAAASLFGFTLPGTNEQVTTIVGGAIGLVVLVWGTIKDHPTTWAGIAGTNLTRSIKKDAATNALNLLQNINDTVTDALPEEATETAATATATPVVAPTDTTVDAAQPVGTTVMTAEEQASLFPDDDTTDTKAE